MPITIDWPKLSMAVLLDTLELNILKTVHAQKFSDAQTRNRKNGD